VAGYTTEVESTGQPAGPDLIALTATQEGIWLAEQSEPGRSGYHDAVSLQLTGPLDVNALKAAFEDAHQVHDALRCRVLRRGDELGQLFDCPAVPWAFEDLSQYTEQQRDRALSRFLGVDSSDPFDLATGPLWRVRLLRLDEDRHVLIIVLHHLITDGWSHGILLRTILGRYGALLQGGVGPWPNGQPALFAEWVRERVECERRITAGDEARVVAGKLAGTARRVALPGLLAHRSRLGAVLPLPIEIEAGRAFIEATKQSGLTRYMAFTGLFALALARRGAAGRLVFAAPVADRFTVSSQQVMGCMINVLPMTVSMAADARPVEAMIAGRDGVIGALEHVAVPYREIARALAVAPSPDASDPVTNVGIEEFNAPSGSWQLGGLTVTSHPRGTLYLRHDLTLSIPRDPSAIPALLYPKHRWEQAELDALAGELAGLVSDAASSAARLRR
jgi:hypothetical protein